MPALPPPPALPLPAGARQRLLLQAQQGLSLADRPFDALGASLGLDGEAVLELLRQWVGQGRIARIGLVFAADAATPGGDALDAALAAATASGLPLVARPYEALGAMLGVPAQRVQQRLADWLRDGRLLRIAAVPAAPAAA